MNEIQHDMNILMEECAEVQIEASKVNRFGLEASYENGPTNKDRLAKELYDLISVIHMVCHKYDISLKIEVLDKAYHEKIGKIEKFKQVSRDAEMLK